MRVEIPVYTDRWMMSDRCGEVIETFPGKNKGGPIHHVRLDKSGKRVRVYACDCREIQMD